MVYHWAIILYDRSSQGLRFNKPLIVIEINKPVILILHNSYQPKRKLTSGQAWMQRTVEASGIGTP